MKSRFNFLATIVACLALASMVSLSAFARGDKDKDAGDKEVARNTAWEALKTLEGTWAMNHPGPDGKMGPSVRLREGRSGVPTDATGAGTARRTM